MSENPSFLFQPDSQPNSKALESLYGELTMPRKSFQLLPDIEKFGTDLTEWIGEKNKQHLIVFTAGSTIEHMHDELQGHDIHVYPKHIVDQNVVLEVPYGSKPLRTVTGLIERDPESYRVVYRLLGEELAKIEGTSLGVPSGNWLDQFAYSPTSDAKYGAELYFLPPYNLIDTRINITADVGSQLADTTNLTETMITQLMWEAHDGWNGN